MPRAKRQPLKAVKNEAQVKAESPTKPAVSAALKKAIDTMDHMRLRLLVKNYCETMEPLREDLEKSLLVPGGDVVRYHADTESEDDKNDDKESSSEDEIKDEDASDIEEAPKERKEKKPIAAADDEMVPRYTICLRCKAEFDVTANDKRDCTWHSGEKEADFEDDFWADHDEDCHGDIDDLVDDPDVQDGFKWSCCGELGDAEGCKWTKHKSDINVIVRKPAHIPASKSRSKRKAEVDVKEPKKKRRT
ncbi:hypothetical protein NA56DRAFT_697154 [Hyaloscypha hepaticicola]|uniref:C2H2-type domain-containing protein n=1 Tax=Hyaloscypha hepaticicola TaxID=2082293 RepID=A0A2J6QL68_9HELO|nr:hypothetical protein NA56DRAFT_697154 [Hyaloscypha hepaticicola]